MVKQEFGKSTFSIIEKFEFSAMLRALQISMWTWMRQLRISELVYVLTFLANGGIRYIVLKINIQHVKLVELNNRGTNFGNFGRGNQLFHTQGYSIN